MPEKKKEEIKTPLKKIKISKPTASNAVKAASDAVKARKPAAKKEKPTASNAAKEVNADFAVIRTGGKQYIVRVGEKHEIEKLDTEEGEAVKFDEVLLVKKGEKIEIGTPKVSGAVVEAKVVSQTKGDKIIVFKYKKRKNYRRKQGHRQKLTEVEIVNI